MAVLAKDTGFLDLLSPAPRRCSDIGSRVFVKCTKSVGYTCVIFAPFLMELALA